jgi:hypothetical protein
VGGNPVTPLLPLSDVKRNFLLEEKAKFKKTILLLFRRR